MCRYGCAVKLSAAVNYVAVWVGLALPLGNDPDGVNDTGDVAEQRQQDI